MTNKFPKEDLNPLVTLLLAARNQALLIKYEMSKGNEVKILDYIIIFY